MAVDLRYSLEQGGSALLTIDAAAQSAAIDGQPCHLTPQEFMLLQTMYNHLGEALSREELLQGAWDFACPGDTRTVDVHIQRLRKKLHIPCIETVHRMGYRLMCPVDKLNLP